MNVNQLCVYEIRVEGHLTKRWSVWFEGMDIRNEPNGETVLSGAFPDQAALFGLLAKIQALNLVLVSVNRVPAGLSKSSPSK